MAKKKRSKKPSKPSDSLFFIKLLLYLILGSIWIKVTKNGDLQVPIPIGLIIGIFFTTHEHFQIDRKIEYMTLIFAALIGYFLPFGLYIVH